MLHAAVDTPKVMIVSGIIRNFDYNLHTNRCTIKHANIQVRAILHTLYYIYSESTGVWWVYRVCIYCQRCEWRVDGIAWSVGRGAHIHLYIYLVFRASILMLSVKASIAVAIWPSTRAGCACRASARAWMPLATASLACPWCWTIHCSDTTCSTKHGMGWT